MAQVVRSAAAHGARVLSVVEKAKLVCWFEETNSFAQVARRYRAEFGMEPPHVEQVKKWHQKFLSTGSVLNGNGGNGSLLHRSSETSAYSSEAPDAAAMEAEEQLKMAQVRA